MPYINYNGLITTPEQITGINRLKYGDGFFDTLRVFNKKISLLPYHERRIIESISILHLDLKKFNLRDEVLKTIEANQLNHARVRVQFCRTEGNRYLPENNSGIFWIETEDDYLTSYELKKVSCVGISKNYYKSKHFLNNIKSSSALLHVMAALEARQMGWEDMILLNEEGLVCETIHSNIFFVNEKDEIVTPPLNSGCLAGVMRAATIDILKSEGCCIEERNIHPNEIPNFKEAFSTNAGSGISQIAQIADTVFKSNLFSIKICHALNKKIDAL